MKVFKLYYKLLLILILFFLGNSLLGQEIILDFVKKEKQNYQYVLGEIPVNVISKRNISQSSLELQIVKIISLARVKKLKNIERVNIKLDNRISMVLFYKSFVVNKNDITSKLNQGVMFYINENDDLIYDFSIFEKDYSIRINGIYDGFEKIENKIATALKNPALFIQQNTPEYLLNEIITNKKSIEALNINFANLMKAWYAYENASFFAGPRPISKDLQEKIVKLKKDNAEITVAEIERILKKEQKIEGVNKQVIQLVIALNFSEFEK